MSDNNRYDGWWYAGGLGIVRLFDYTAIALVIVLRLVGLYRRRRLARRVRLLAAAQPLGEVPLDEFDCFCDSGVSLHRIVVILSNIVLFLFWSNVKLPLYNREFLRIVLKYS